MTPTKLDVELERLTEKNFRTRMSRKLERAKQYLADRGIAAMGPNSTFIYTDSKGKTHAPTTSRRPGMLHPSGPSDADDSGAAALD